MSTKLQRRLQERLLNGYLLYIDGRGQRHVHASYRMPRKLKKAWRSLILKQVRLMPFVDTVRWKLWWKPRVGWTLKTLARKDRSVGRG